MYGCMSTYLEDMREVLQNCLKIVELVAGALQAIGTELSEDKHNKGEDMNTHIFFAFSKE